MPAYMIADVEVTDPAGYDEYRRGVAATLEPFGGRFVVRGGRTQVLEGSWQPKRCVVIEFPSMEQLKAWYDSPAYAPLIALRQRVAKSHLTAVEGVAG
jgi:uncharacterized protein (DUF1330 family)